MFIYELIVLAVIIVLDIASKYGIVKGLGVVNRIQTKGDITVIKNFISLSYGENTGAAFGVFKGRTTALIIVTAIALAVLVVYMFLIKKENKFMRLCLIMILGGGIGNLYDRIFIGYVRDFIRFDFFRFPVFNVADSFITVGTIMLCVYIIFFSARPIVEKAESLDKSTSSNKIEYADKMVIIENTETIDTVDKVENTKVVEKIKVDETTKVDEATKEGEITKVD